MSRISCSVEYGASEVGKVLSHIYTFSNCQVKKEETQILFSGFSVSGSKYICGYETGECYCSTDLCNSSVGQYLNFNIVLFIFLLSSILQIK